MFPPFEEYMMVSPCAARQHMGVREWSHLPPPNVIATVQPVKVGSAEQSHKSVHCGPYVPLTNV